MITVFWMALLLLAYAYAGYPLLIRAWAALRHGRAAPPHGPAEGASAGAPGRGDEAWPRVSILVVAHNEAERIEARVRNLLGLDYPRDLLEIVVGSDGSTDDTVECLRSFRTDGVTVADFGTRRGKPAVLNDLVPRCRGAIVVLADARQRFEPGALRALVRPFADPAVGAASGELILDGGSGEGPAAKGIARYWRLETSIRAGESRVDSIVGATGAIYAVRRDLFEPIPEDTVLDDVLIPMRIVRRGYRVVWAEGARAHDRVAASARGELARKIRTIAGNFQLFARQPWLLHPLRNRLWLQTVSHKSLRLLGPPLLAAILGANLALAGRPFYRMTLAAQAIFYAAAAAGALPGAARRLPILSAPFTVLLLNWATLVAFCRVITGTQRITWERADDGGADPARRIA